MDRNARVGLLSLGAACAMLGLGYASVPLYRIFCQVTGFGGTPGRVDEAQAATVKGVGRMITVRFDTNTERGLGWDFRPEVRKQDLPIGERKIAVFDARNDSGRDMVGQAVFNVSPEQAGQYFKKIQCFCFNEQKLAAGESVRMPVIYYVDPAILDDPNTRNIAEITLSYTFMEHPNPTGVEGSAGASAKSAAK